MRSMYRSSATRSSGLSRPEAAAPLAALSAVPAVSVAIVFGASLSGRARDLPLRRVAPDAGSPRPGASPMGARYRVRQCDLRWVHGGRGVRRGPAGPLAPAAVAAARRLVVADVR